MGFPFYKYQSLGNDFVLIEEDVDLPLDDAIVALLNRRYGAGADGLIVLRASSQADKKVIFFNSDGSRPALCLNALSITFFHLKKECSIETDAGIYLGDERGVYLPPARILNSELVLEDLGVKGFFCDTGVPHFVVETKIDHPDLMALAKKIRNHVAFGDAGTNVDLIQISKGEVLARVYERGVEGETDSCGTGAYAIFLSTKFPIIRFKSGTMELQKEGEQLKLRTAPKLFFLGSYLDG